MRRPSTRSVQRVATVSVPRCQGALVRLSGVKVSWECVLAGLPRAKTKIVKSPTSAMRTAMTRVRLFFTSDVALASWW